MDFPLPDTAYLENSYRPLKERDPVMRGWDVFAVQTGLLFVNANALPLYGPDGFYGEESGDSVESFQRRRKLWVDRIAGGETMREIARIAARWVTNNYGLPAGLAKGQFERESSLLPPNFSAVRTNRTRDNGLVQLNSQFTDPELAFDVRRCVVKYGSHVQRYYNKYRSWGLGEQRAWELAAGSWNAPTWCDELAQGGTLEPDQQAHIDAYIEAVTALIRW